MTLKSFLTPRPERNETPLLALRREIDRLFDEFGRAWTTPDIVGLTPRINMLQREGHTELTIELIEHVRQRASSRSLSSSGIA